MSQSEVNELNDHRAEHWAGVVRCVTVDGVQTDVATKQALLPAVPAGRKRIPTRIVMRNASADLGGFSGQPSSKAGFNAGADDVFVENGTISGLDDATKFVIFDAFADPSNGGVSVAGAAGEILGFIFGYTAIAATVSFDVFYYDVPA